LADSAKYLFVFSGILFSAFAQISMKKATNFDERSILWNTVLIVSVICYFASFVSYYYALKSFPISKIAPVMTVGVVVLVVAFGVLSGEHVTATQGVGILLATISIIFIMH
jgi:drug/metabolite transporter (DMT)-like permease